jgi:molybdopterin-guanine dinucleotide biosynthesis adapter protein
VTDRRPLLIQVVGESGSGKTLVVERCVRRLLRRRLTVAVVKHSHHAPDLPGKDTSRFARAGAQLVLFSGTASFLTFRWATPDLIRSLPADVVLIEGYSRRRFGPLRYTVGSPRQASEIVERVVRAAPRRPRSATIRLDGRTKRADPLWRLVGNVMAVRGVREIRSAR